MSPATATLEVGQGQTFQASVSADAGANQAVTWSAAPAGILSITQSGVATAIAAGQATVTATSVAAPGVTGSAVVTVRLPATVTRTVNASDTVRMVVGSGSAVTVPPGALPAGATVRMSEVPSASQPGEPRVELSIVVPSGSTWSNGGRLLSGRDASGFVVAPPLIVDLPIVPPITGAAETIGRVRSTTSGATAQEAFVPADAILDGAGSVGSRVARYGLIGGLNTSQDVSIERIRLPTAEPGSARLYRAGSRGAVTTSTSSAVPVVLIHGIQPFAKSIDQFAGWWPDEAGELWDVMRRAINDDPQLAGRVELWTYRYPTFQSVSANTAAFSNAVSQQLGGRRPFIVAHSMGGLVSVQTMLASPTFARRLISLGTPYLGSPLADRTTTQLTNVRGYNNEECRTGGYLLSGAGYPINLWLASGNAGFADLRTTGPLAVGHQTSLGALSGSITAVAGTNPNLGPATFGCAFSGPSDGVVAVASAHPPGLATRLTVNANHLNIAENAEAVQRVLSELRAQVASEPARVRFATAPSTVAVGQPITPALQVAVETASGDRVTTSTAAVTIAIASGPAGAVLSGTRTRNAVAGLATFPDLQLDRAGTYTLTATSGTLSSATSATFTVQAQTPAITALEVSPAALSLAVGASATATATIGQPQGAPAATITYASLNPAIASVSGSGASRVILGVRSGTTTIRVTATASGTMSFSAATLTQDIAVAVTERPDPLVQTLSATNITATALTMNGTVNPQGVAPIDYFFEYAVGSTTCTPSSTTPLRQLINGATTPVPVADALSGGTPGQTLSYRLVAARSGGAVQRGACTVTAFDSPSEGIPSGLVAFYRLDGNGNDASGNGVNGTLQGSPTAVAGRTGQPGSALSFTGNAHVRVPSSAAIRNLTQELSLVFWVKRGASNIQQGMLPLARREFGNRIHFIAYAQAGGFAFQCCSSGGSAPGMFYTPSGNGLAIINDGAWHQYALVRKFGFGGYTVVYLDGVPIAGSYTFGTASDTQASFDADLLIGRQASTSTGQFIGQLDDIMIFNRALSRQEIIGIR